jgi:quercetin dioxygenase-like cupin family protein
VLFWPLVPEGGILMAERDAIQADPKHYTVEAEDDRVRVLRVRYGAGERSVMHSHPANAVIFVTDAHVRFNDQSGGPQEAHGKAGDVMLAPATTHEPENTGGQPFEVILVELKS